MGLDMYLNCIYYIRSKYYIKNKDEYHITITCGGKPAPIPTDKIIYIETEGIYWRKANAIHRWFVENVQGGVDDCRVAKVRRDKLGQLLVDIDKVLKQPKLARRILPTKFACFFGDFTYGKTYFEDLKRTRKELIRLLQETKGQEVDFVYFSVW